MPSPQSPMPPPAMPPTAMPRKIFSLPSMHVPRPGEAVSTPVPRSQEERATRNVALASSAGQESGSRPGSLLLVAERATSLARDRTSLSQRTCDRTCMKGYTPAVSRRRTIPPAGDELHLHLPAITWCHASTGCYHDSTNMDRAAATTLIQRNQPALPDQKDVYLLWTSVTMTYAL